MQWRVFPYTKPSKGTYYLCSVENRIEILYWHEMRLCWYRERGSGYVNIPQEKVHAWMPLPPPFKRRYT